MDGLEIDPASFLGWKPNFQERAVEFAGRVLNLDTCSKNLRFSVVLLTSSDAQKAKYCNFTLNPACLIGILKVVLRNTPHIIG